MTDSLSREDIVRQVKEAADIIEVIGEVVRLTRTGASHKGLCPFHAEKTPSFSVNPQRRYFRCYGCGEGGDVLHFLMKYHSITFPEALKNLARRYHIDLPERELSPAEKKKSNERSEVFAVNSFAAKTFHHHLLDHPAAREARDYLEDRAIPAAITADWQIGFAPDSWDFLSRLCQTKGYSAAAAKAGLLAPRKNGGNYDRFRSRLLFPVHDTAGRVIGFSGRIIGEGEPKYLNTPETIVFDKGRNLFGLHRNREAIRRAGTCLMVEGNFDLLSLVAAGIDNVVAPLGTALTRNHLRLLKGYTPEVIIFFDGDGAGVKAAIRAVPLCLAEGVIGRVALLPEGEDPDSLVRNRGADAVRELVSRAVALPEFVFDRLAEQYSLSMDGKTRIIAELRRILQEADPDPSTAAIFASHFAARLAIAPEIILAGGHNKKIPPVTGNATTGEKSLPFKARQLIEFLIIFPEYLQKFIKAGIEEVIQESQARRILELLTRAGVREQTSSVHDRLLALAGPDDREYLTALLVATPDYPADEVEPMADEKLAWLARTIKKKRQRELTDAIIAAQQAGDKEKCLELMARKNQTF